MSTADGKYSIVKDYLGTLQVNVLHDDIRFLSYNGSTLGAEKLP